MREPDDKRKCDYKENGGVKHDVRGGGAFLCLYVGLKTSCVFTTSLIDDDLAFLHLPKSISQSPLYMQSTHTRSSLFCASRTVQSSYYLRVSEEPRHTRHQSWQASTRDRCMPWPRFAVLEDATRLGNRLQTEAQPQPHPHIHGNRQRQRQRQRSGPTEGMVKRSD